MSFKIKKVLVSQPKPSNDKSPYFEIAKKHEVEIDFRPFIKVERLPLSEFKEQRIEVLDFTAIIFTSRTAADMFFSICEELRIDIPDTMKYFCNSESTALYLQKYIVYRKRRIFFSKTGKIEGLAANFKKHNKEKYLFPVTEQHKSDLTEVLDNQKLTYTKSIMYRTVSNDFKEDEYLAYDLMLLFSPLGVDSLVKNFPNFVDNPIAVGAFGKATAKSLEEIGVKLDIEAPSPGITSMTGALEQYLKEANK